MSDREAETDDVDFVADGRDVPAGRVGRRRLLQAAGTGVLLGSAVERTAAQSGEADGPTVYATTEREETSLVAVDAASGDEVWSFDDADVGSSAAVTVADGRVFVPAADGDGAQLFALEAATGEEVWRAPPADYNREVVPASNPTVVDGRVYTGRYALDAATGQVLWETDVGLGESVQVVDGRVVSTTGGGGGRETTLYALDAVTGDRLWEFSVSDGRFTGPTLFEGTAYVVDDTSGTLYAVDAVTGEQVWEYSPSEGPASNGPLSVPTVADGRVYAFGFITGSNVVQAFDPDSGEELWRFSVPSSYTGITPPPIFDDGSIYGVFQPSVVYAIDAASGEQEWEQTVEYVSGLGSPTTYDGSLYLQGRDETELLSLDASSGEVQWRRSRPGEVTQSSDATYSPTVVDDPAEGASVGSRVGLGVLGHTDTWADRAGLRVSVEPANTTLLSGTTDEIIFEVTNEGEEPLTDLTVSAETESDQATVVGTEIVGIAGELSPGATAEVAAVVRVDNAPTARTSVELEATISDDGTSTEVTRRVSAAVVPAVTVAAKTPRAAGSVSPGSEVPVDFVVQVNQQDSLAAVELQPNVSSLPGEWSVVAGESGQLPIDTSRRPAGGEWTGVGETPVWSIDDLAAGETQRPGLTLSVPENVADGEASVTPTVEVETGRGSVTLSNLDAGTVSVRRRYFTFDVEVAGTELQPSNPTPLEGTLFVEEAVTDPEILVGLPDGFDVRDSEATVDGDGSLDRIDEGLAFRWSGEFDAGTVLSGSVPVTPGEEQAGAFTETALGRVTPNRSNSQGQVATDGGQPQRRQRSLSVSYNVPVLNRLIDQKRSLADAINDQTAPAGAFDDLTEREKRLLDDIEAAVFEDEGPDLTETEAERLLQRLLWTETLSKQALDYFRPGGTRDDAESLGFDPQIGRRLASNILSSLVALALSAFGPLKILKKVGGLNVGERTLKTVLAERANITAIKNALKSTDRFDRLEPLREPAKDLGEEVADTALNTAVTTAAGMIDEINAAAEDLTDGVEFGVVRDTLQEEPIAPGRRFIPGTAPTLELIPSLRDATRRVANTGEAALESGSFPGDHEAAKKQWDAVRSASKKIYGLFLSIIEDFEEGLFTELEKLNGSVEATVGGTTTVAPIFVWSRVVDGVVRAATLADGEPSLEDAVSYIRDQVELAIQTADTIISFFGPFHATLVNFAAVEALHWAMVLGMELVRQGSTDIVDGLSLRPDF